jgi:hypothetical protein
VNREQRSAQGTYEDGSTPPRDSLELVGMYARAAWDLSALALSFDCFSKI